MIRVNGELINPELIEESFARIKTEMEQRSQTSCCERDGEFMAQAEEEVVDSILIAQEAEKCHDDLPEEEVRAELERMIKLYREHGASWEMLEQQRDQLRGEVEANFRIERLIRDHTTEVAAPSEEELRSYYESRSRDYRSIPEVSCLHLIKLLEGQDDQRSLLEEMTVLRERVLAGEDFAALALAETDKTSKEVDLGWIPLDRPGNPFEAVLFSLREGEVSPVLSYEHAFHLVQVTGRRGGGAPPFEELRVDLENRFLREKRQESLRVLALQLREKATIETVDFEAKEG